MRIAITTDSGSSIKPEEAKALGISVVPMPFMLNDETYYEDINITEEEFYNTISTDITVRTSQPSVASVKELFDELLKEYDAIIHIPLTSGLSGSCQSAMLAASDCEEGKVFVVDNHKVSVSQRQSILDAIELVKEGKTPEEVKEILENRLDDNSIYIGLGTLDYLIAGGRVTGAAAALGSLLKIKPILSIIEGGKLDSYSKARTKKGVKKGIIEALKKDAENKFNDPEGTHCHFAVAYAGNKEEAESFAQEIKAAFPNRLEEEVPLKLLSEILVCHTGPEALGAMIMNALD